jgi:hypothetical protein
LHHRSYAIPEPDTIGNGIHSCTGYFTVLNKCLLALPDPDPVPDNAVDSALFDHHMLMGFVIRIFLIGFIQVNISS